MLTEESWRRARCNSLAVRLLSTWKDQGATVEDGQGTRFYITLDFTVNYRKYYKDMDTTRTSMPRFPSSDTSTPLWEYPECKGRTSGCRKYGDDPPMEPLLIWIRQAAYQSLELEVRSSNGHSRRRHWQGSIRFVRRWIYTSR